MQAAQKLATKAPCRHQRRGVRAVGRRAIPDPVREEVDHRLKTAAHPDCKQIAGEMTAAGRPVSTGYVWGRAQYLQIKLPGRPGGRPAGSKDTKPRKERTNTLYSQNRDEVLRLLAEGISNMAEIARELGISPQWARKLAAAITQDEINALRSSAVTKKS